MTNKRDLINHFYFKDELLIKSYSIKYEFGENFVLFSLKKIKNGFVPSIEFYIEFVMPIVAWRNFDYKWVKMDEERIANDYSPKILVLRNMAHVMSDRNIGLWYFTPRYKKRIKWVLKHPKLTPIVQFDSSGRKEVLSEFPLENFELKLLFSNNEVPEFSRSKIPFSPIICFTDHCDFDNTISLKKQLMFFNKNNIKISKGFFLYHYSKREDNASMEYDKIIYDNFNKSGHELFYHSLTQSRLPKNKAFSIFNNFKPPYDNISTWVDHGYQPYNFTMQKTGCQKADEWSDNLSKNMVINIWSYMDTGPSGISIINQLNPAHFTIKRQFSRSILKKEKIRLLFRTIMYFSGNDKIKTLYKNSADCIKSIMYKGQFSSIIKLVPNLLKLIPWFLRALIESNIRNRPFKYAKFAPLIFNYIIGETRFSIFQTVEVQNLEDTFCESNIDLLLKEKGVIICHTYFSSPRKYQVGKLFNDEQISKNNQHNFDYLGKLIEKGVIWNPTISELIFYYNCNKNIVYGFNSNSDRIIVTSPNLDKIKLRYVKYV